MKFDMWRAEDTENPIIKIFISCHKDCYVPKHPLLYPIQVGAALAEKRLPCFLHDDEGDNISVKNKMYCELTAQYWAWKNAGADYYGFWHYRRYMSFAEKELAHNPFEDVEMDWLDDEVLQTLNLDENAMREKIQQYDVIAATPVVLKKLHKDLKSNRHQYELTSYQYKEDIDVLLDIIKERYPEFYDIALYYFDKSPVGYYCNMFIMRRDVFREYSAWLFDILAEHEKRRDYTDYSVAGYRVSGYLGERLFAIYYLWLKQSGKYRCCELQRTLFKDTERYEELLPVFAQRDVVVALAADKRFAPCLAVTLASIAESSSAENNYDILILTTDIPTEDRKLISGIVAGRGNFSVRFVNPCRFIGKFTPYLHWHFGHIETYYRLILPWLLPRYDKVLYLDSDMVVAADVAELFSEKVDGFLLAACHDADTAGLYNGYWKDRKKYTDEILHLAEPYQYFQAGTLLMNLAEFRREYTVSTVLDFAAKERWQLQDQDVLNKLCEGRVRYVDMAWNVMVDYNGIRREKIIALAPQWLNRMYMEARKSPKIIHYAGPEKPWLNPEMDYGREFWRSARLTPYYEALLHRMAEGAAEHRIEAEKETRRRNSPFRLACGFFRRARQRGLVEAVSYIPKRILQGRKRK